MAIDLTDPIFTDENAARAHFEQLRWPNGPFCPHCGSIDSATELKAKYQAWHLQVPRVPEAVHGDDRHALRALAHPAAQVVLATHLMCASKKGMSAHQLFRMFGFGSYRTAWFMAHRIREGMRELIPRIAARLAARTRWLRLMRATLAARRGTARTTSAEGSCGFAG